MSGEHIGGIKRIAPVYLSSLVEGTCPTGKLRFRDAASADRALELAALRARNQLRRRERSTYRCGHCEGHHLSSGLPSEVAQ